VNVELLLEGALYGAILLGFLFIPVLFLVLILGLAKYDMFWTVVAEGRAKAIMVNDKFEKFVMAYHGKKFKGKKEGDDWIDQWDIVGVDSDENADGYMQKLPLIGGLRWVGIWPFARVYKYHFTWTSLEQQSGKDDQTEETKLVANTTEVFEKSDILLQEDIYAVLVTDVETSEMLPVTALLQIPAKVTNPYKALFRVQHWLEQSENLIADKARAFMGGLPFANLIQRLKPNDSGGTEKFEKITNIELDNVLETINTEYGVEIPHIGIRKIDPASDEALKFKEASGALYVADQKAKADKREGEGKRDRVTEYYTAVSKIPGGKEMFLAEAIRDSKLRVITTSGSGVLPTVLTEDVSEGEKSA